MKRRTFLQMIGAAVAACLLGFKAKEEVLKSVSTELLHPWQPDCPYPVMPHLYYEPEEGVYVAAPTLEQAVYYHDVELCGLVEAEQAERHWQQVPDGAKVTISVETEEGKWEKVTQTAKEWANEMRWVEVVASTDW